MRSSSCDSEQKSVRRDNGSVFRAEDVDVAAHLAAGVNDEPLDPKVAVRLRYEGAERTFYGLTPIPRRKIDMYILPFMCSTYMHPPLPLQYLTVDPHKSCTRMSGQLQSQARIDMS